MDQIDEGILSLLAKMEGWRSSKEVPIGWDCDWLTSEEHDGEQHWFEANPLKDDALCFALMRKYHVAVSVHIQLKGAGTVHWLAQAGGDQIEHKSLNYAICLAIIASPLNKSVRK